MQWSSLEIPLKYLVCTVFLSHSETTGPPTIPQPPPDRMTDSSGAAEWRYWLWGACRCLSGCLSRTDGEGEMMETEPVRSAIYSPVRSSSSRAPSSCLSTHRQEAKPLLSFPDWLHLSSLRFGTGCLCLNRSPIFNSLIIPRFHVSLLFCFSSEGK